MNQLAQLYRHSLTLLTDLYQLTMAYGYWKSGTAEHEAVFHQFFRTAPFSGGYAVAAGLDTVIDYLENFHFTPDDSDYLATLQGNDGKPLFDKAFLAYLEGLRLTCEIDAVAEGTLMFPHEPMLRVRGPLLQCQLLETTLLTILNFQTLIATKSSRVCMATQGEPVLEFGLRRAQGIDGGLSASRAAYIGGCAATSNVLAGKLYGIPVKGTHAHSWIMSFDSEAGAFQTYAEAMPNNCVFLVDTYDTIEGIKRAIETGKKLRGQGHEMVGIRLDSGDLAELSIAARKLLDDAGFPAATIVASNDLNEYSITELKQKGATINIWGVGTKLATAYEQAALGGVYKLSAIRRKQGDWQHRLKLSEDPIKVSNPGILQVRRFRDGDKFNADMLYDELHPPQGDFTLHDLANPQHVRQLPASTEYQDLLQAICRKGETVYQRESLETVRARVQEQLAAVGGGVKRFTEAERYPVSLEAGLQQRKQELMDKMSADKA